MAAETPAQLPMPNPMVAGPAAPTVPNQNVDMQDDTAAATQQLAAQGLGDMPALLTRALARLQPPPAAEQQHAPPAFQEQAMQPATLGAQQVKRLEAQAAAAPVAPEHLVNRMMQQLDTDLQSLQQANAQRGNHAAAEEARAAETDQLRQQLVALQAQLATQGGHMPIGEHMPLVPTHTTLLPQFAPDLHHNGLGAHADPANLATSGATVGNAATTDVALPPAPPWPCPDLGPKAETFRVNMTELPSLKA